MSTTSTRSGRTKRAARRTASRRLLVLGAVVGLAVGMLAQPIASGLHGDTAWIARIALMFPGLVFLAWWLLAPGVRTEDQDVVQTRHERSVQQRMERIVAEFDPAAVPKAGRRIVTTTDDAVLEEYQRSIRRAEPTSSASRAQFVVRRSALPRRANGR